MNKCLTILIVIAAFVFSSCGITKKYNRPDLKLNGLYRDIKTDDTTSIATLKWTELFTDIQLQNLINQGLENNPDLLIAYTRIQEAEAYYKQSFAAFFPTLFGDARYTRSRFSESQTFANRPGGTQYQLGFSSSWELDIWGKLRSSRRANFANLLQSEAGANAVKTRLISDIANLYFTLLALDQQLIITKQTVSNWDTTVNTMRALKEAARVTEAAVVQSEAQRYAAEVTIPDLRQRIRETENTLSILLGLPPAEIQRGTLEDQKITDVLKTGVPAQLLANRPDVIQAEMNYRYNFELTNVARTNFYPSLTITGNAALTAFTTNALFNQAALSASVTAGLLQPIFNARNNRTRLDVARAQQQTALINFQNTLLNAGREVSDALSLYENAFDKITIRASQMTALERSVQYSLELLRNGFANYTEIITARQSLLQAELGSVNDRLQQLQAVVELYRALGGGYK